MVELHSWSNMPFRNVQVGLSCHYLNSSRLFHIILDESLEYFDKKYTKTCGIFKNLFNMYNFLKAL